MDNHDNNTESNLSVFKVIISYFCGIFSYIAIGGLLAVIISLILVLLYSFSITRAILGFIFFLRKDGGELFIVTTSSFFAAMATEHIVRRINVRNPLQAQKSLWGIGVSFLVFGIIMLVINFFADQSVIGNIYMILVGLYFKSTNSKS